MKNTTLKARFKILKDGWIKDDQTKLEWGKSAESSMNFQNALDYCKKQGGRMPSRFELESIQDLTKYNPCINKSIFLDTKSDYYWSNTPCVSWKESVWVVSFGFGYVDDRSEGSYSYVRPVRASQ